MAGQIDIISNIFDTLDMVMTWLITAIDNATKIFINAEGDLSIMGVFALMGLAVSITLLVVNIVKNFIQFRG